MSIIENNKYILSSLDNALHVLDILRTRNDIGVSELSRLSGLGKSSTYNILATLERRSYVKKTPDARYSLGAKFFDHGGVAQSSKSLIEIATPIISRLVAKTGATVWLGVLNANGRVMAIISEEGTAPDSPPRRVGFEGEANAFSTGKVLLAHLDEAVLHALFAQKQFKRYTSSTVVLFEELVYELKAVREKGYAIDLDERYLGYGSISVPVFDSAQKCMAAITIIMTTDTIQRNHDTYCAILQKAANTLCYLNSSI